MNHRAAWRLIQSTWLSWMEQRSFFFILAFGWMLSPLIYLFVWATAASEEPVAGISRDEFIVYYLAFIVVNQVTYAVTQWTVGFSIQSGAFSSLLLYPMSPVYNTLASEIAGKIVFLAFVLPVTLVLGLLLRPEVTISLNSILLFLPALLLAWALRFVWGYWMALLAFWTSRTDGLLVLQDALIFVFAGQIAPLALLPGFLQGAATTLPFRYMISFPVEVLTGQLSSVELVTGFSLQGGWLMISLIMYHVVMRQGLRHYTAVGG